jgi:hypothetical protein
VVSIEVEGIGTLSNPVAATRSEEASNEAKQ